MNELFNTSFETGLRVLLVLKTISPEGATVDRIAAYDFMSIYGRDFGVSETNLHGDNSFNFSELSTKRAICTRAVKEIALDGLISVSHTERGFIYKLNKNGEDYVAALNADYASQYLTVAKTIHTIYSRMTDNEISADINNKAVQALRRR